LKVGLDEQGALAEVEAIGQFDDHLKVAFALTLLHNSMSMSSQDVVRAVTYFRLANILPLYAPA
jgi:dTDP-4-dehydrorhamnose 3,5-epimerase-like enzyme